MIKRIIKIAFTGIGFTNKQPQTIQPCGTSTCTYKDTDRDKMSFSEWKRYISEELSKLEFKNLELEGNRAHQLYMRGFMREALNSCILINE